MAQRNLSRSIIVSTLYAVKMHPLPDVDAIQKLITYIGNVFLKGNPDYAYAEYIIFAVMKKRAIIDDILLKAAPRFPLEKMNLMDVIILRMAIYELVFEYTKIHPDIIISEAVSLGQTYVGQSGARFINGVLSTVYREMGSPVGPLQQRRIEMSNEVIAAHQYKTGAFVYAFNTDGVPHVALVQDIWGFWTFPKGAIENGEDTTIACIRKIKEEIGLDVTLERVLGISEYESFPPQQGRTINHMTYYVARSEFVPLALEDSGGLVASSWFPLSEIADLRMYENVAQMSITAIRSIFTQKTPQ